MTTPSEIIMAEVERATAEAMRPLQECIEWWKQRNRIERRVREWERAGEL